MRRIVTILLGIFLTLRSSAAPPPTYTFAPSGKDGGGCMVSVAPDPFTPGRVIAGGDSWPFHRTTNYGRDWTPVAVRDASDNSGLFNSANNMSAAATRFSLKTTNLVYAATGVIMGGGGFIRSTNGGSAWVKASNIPTFVGDNDSAPLVAQGHPRSVGNLIALDPTGAQEYIYVGTYSNGVMRSHDAGNTWTTIAIPELLPPFIRGLAMSDVDPTTLYVATYDTSNDGTNESIYQIQNARAATSANLVSQAPFSKAEEIVVVNGILYVAANTNGIYKYDPAGQTWTQLYQDATPSQFYSIDGFWDSGANQAVIFAGTTAKAKPGGNGLVFSLLRSKDSGSNWVCLTTNTSQIHSNMVMGGPGGDIWWLSAASAGNVTDCLGGSQFVACQTVLDPSDPTHKTIYVCGHSGLWRSDDALTTDSPVWYPCMRHLQAAGSAAEVADPNSPNRAACVDVDWTFQYSTDNFSHVTQKKTSLGGSDEWCLETDATTAPGPGNVSPLYLGRDMDLLYCANPSTGSWISTGLGSVIKTNVYGCSIKYLSGIGTVVLAGLENSGIWRKIGAGNTGSWGTTPVFTGNNVMQNTAASLRAVFSWGGGNSQMVYLNDRVNGIFRSLDAGLSWTMAAATSGSQRTGSVAVDPTDDSICYYTRTTGLFASTNANAASPTFTKVTLPGVIGSVTPGWVVCDDAGNVYVNTLINTSNQPKLFYKGKGDATWYELSQGDLVFESMCGTTIQLMVGPGPAHVLYLSGLGMAVGTQSYQIPTLQVSLAGTNLVLNGTGGASIPYSVLSSTNLSLPTSNWTLLTTQAFDANGNFSWTNNLDLTDSARFYRLVVP